MWRGIQEEREKVRTAVQGQCIKEFWELEELLEKNIIFF
jgi:hypothetical protein